MLRLLSLVAIALLAVGLWLLHENRALAASLAEVRRDSAARDARNGKLIADLRRQVAEAAKTARRTQDSAAAGRLSRQVERNLVGTADMLRDHPEFLPLDARIVRRHVVNSYGRTLDRMSLPPAQKAKLLDLLVERQLTVQDAAGAAKAAGMEPFGADSDAAVKQATAELDSEIDALVGPGGWAEFQKKASADNFAHVMTNVINDEYGATFAQAGSPLTGEQAEALAVINREAYLPGGVPVARDVMQTPDPQTFLTPVDSYFIRKAAAVLTPAQLELVKAERRDNGQRQLLLRAYYGPDAVLRDP